MLESAASGAHVPMSWMIADAQYFSNAATYAQFHAQNGDEVDAALSLSPAASALFPWYRPAVSVEGAGKERNIQGLLAAGETGFWGITWDSQGIDSTADMGAPWGTYCADPSSYKRPESNGDCDLLAFEWTARDLTRAYLSRLDYFYSTDPDDLQLRAGFDVAGASSYERELVDAYAAAGQTTPLVMMSQQESAEQLNPGDQQIMTALYQQAANDRMKLETLTQADSDARAFSALPRAVAFPFIPGGTATPSSILPNDSTLYPATIDYHDTVAGMTFLAGHTTPQRVFRYSDDPISLYNVPLAQLASNEIPTLTGVAVTANSIAFSFRSPIAVHYGVALWTDPSALSVSGPGVTPAGHAGTVLTFDLKQGPNIVTFRCPGCSSTTFQYAS